MSCSRRQDPQSSVETAHERVPVRLIAFEIGKGNLEEFLCGIAREYSQGYFVCFELSWIVRFVQEEDSTGMQRR